MCHRLENQKLKELVTGGADPAVQTDSEPEDAKEEPVKEESPSVRSKMEMTTPSKVGKSPPPHSHKMSCADVDALLFIF